MAGLCRIKKIRHTSKYGPLMAGPYVNMSASDTDFSLRIAIR